MLFKARLMSWRAQVNAKTNRAAHNRRAGSGCASGYRMNKSRNNNNASRSVLALNIQLARTVFGLTQDELAQRCGLKRSYIGALERSEINLGLDNVDRIAAGLGIEPHVLLLNPDLAQPILRATRRPSP